jgi:serine phosphatase RsbU (regulator of sigma subunit)
VRRLTVAIPAALAAMALATGGYADAKPKDKGPDKAGPPAAAPVEGAEATPAPAPGPEAAPRGKGAGNGGAAPAPARGKGAAKSRGDVPGRANGAGGRSNGSGRGNGAAKGRAAAPGQIRKAAARGGSPAAGRTRSSATPPATPGAAPAPAPIAAPAAAAPAPPTQAAAPKATPRRKARARTRRGTTRARTRALPAAAPAAPVVSAPAAVAPAPRARAPRTRAPRVAAPRKAAPRRGLTRIVTHVVEVIPRPVRFALAGLAALAALLGLALLAAALRAGHLKRQRARLKQDVGLLQSAVLPELPERVGRASVTAAYRPAEGLAAGGDFYDAFALDDDRTCVILGDVAGHGRDAIPVTALVRYTVRAYLEGGLAPRQALQVAGRVLEPQLRETMVTVLVAIYDAATGLLTVAAAGHPLPLISTDEAPPVAAFSSPALGLGGPTGRRQVTVPLPPGAAACFYTDGLADVLTEGERLMPTGLAGEIRRLSREDGAAELIARLVRDSDSQPDDMACVVLRPPDDAPSPRTGRVEELEVDARDVTRGRLDRYLDAYRVSPGVADAARRAVANALRRSHSVVIEIAHDASGAHVSVADSPAVVALPLDERGDEQLAAAG